MSISKRPTGWQVQVKPFPRQTVPTKKAALDLELQLKLRKGLGQFYVAAPTTLGDELDAYVARLETLGGRRGQLAPNSLALYKARAAHWESLRPIKLSQLSRVDVETLVVSVAAKHPTAARDMLKMLRRCLRSAQARGQTVDVGIFEIRPQVERVEAVTKARALSLEEVARLADGMPAYIRRAIPFAASCGLRFDELLSLTDDRVDLEAATLLIPAAMCKERRTKLIPLSRYEVQLLRRQMLERAPGATIVFASMHGKKIGRSVFRKQWDRAREIAGLEGYKFHWLRHTAISTMAAAGMPVETIAARVGHSDGGALILSTYRHLFGGEVKKAVEYLDTYYAAQELSPLGPRLAEDSL